MTLRNDQYHQYANPRPTKYPTIDLSQDPEIESKFAPIDGDGLDASDNDSNGDGDGLDASDNDNAPQEDGDEESEESEQTDAANGDDQNAGEK